MTTTAQQILDRATQLSMLNNPDLIPTAQVLDYISLYERYAYQRAAQLNPDYFGQSGDTSARAAFTDSWDLATTPGNIGAITRAEVKTIIGSVTGVAVGDKVNLISLRWPDIEVSPRGYIRGRKIFGYKNELGAASINMVSVLTIFFAQIPAKVTTLSQSLTLPDEWADLVTFPVARLLALRDRRQDEVQILEGMHKDVIQLFDTAITAYDHGVRRPINAVPPPIPLLGMGGGKTA